MTPGPSETNAERLPRAAYTVLSPHAVEASGLTRGPWDPGHQHGGPPVAMVCRAIEAVANEHGLGHIGRLTANLLRPVPIGKLEIEVITDYSGRNAAHYSARIRSHDKEIARFTALAQRENTVLLPDKLDGHPLPKAPRSPADSPIERIPFTRDLIGYGDLVENRVAGGRMFRGPSAVWFRLNHPLVAGETPSGYQRVAVAADSSTWAGTHRLRAPMPASIPWAFSGRGPCCRLSRPRRSRQWPTILKRRH